MNNINAYTDKIMNHYNTGTTKGVELGFQCLNDLITIKPKYTTYILGFPRAGKTEFHLEILFNLTEKYGQKHAIMSPEIGGVEDVIAELISKHLRKPFFKSSAYGATEKEIYRAMAFLSEYFYVLDNDQKDYDIDTFYDECKKIERDNRIKLNTTSIDPWNDLEEDLSKHGNREDKYLAKALRKVRSSAKVNDWHNFIVTHAKDMPPVEFKSSEGGNVFCTSMPTLQSFAGGQVWSRRAFNVVALWKPEINAINPVTGQRYFDNEAIVKILKAKPKGVGKLGYTSLYFDWKTNRYFEKIDSYPYYAFEHLIKAPKYREPSEEIFNTMPQSEMF